MAEGAAGSDSTLRQLQPLYTLQFGAFPLKRWPTSKKHGDIFVCGSKAAREVPWWLLKQFYDQRFHRTKFWHGDSFRMIVTMRLLRWPTCTNWPIGMQHEMTLNEWRLWTGRPRPGPHPPLFIFFFVHINSTVVRTRFLRSLVVYPRRRSTTYADVLYSCVLTSRIWRWWSRHTELFQLFKAQLLKRTKVKKKPLIFHNNFSL